MNRIILSAFFVICSFVSLLACINGDSIFQIVIYPPFHDNSNVAISNSRVNFLTEYSGTGLKSYTITDSAHICQLVKILSELEYLGSLSYSNTDTAILIDVDSTGIISTRPLNPPILGQMILCGKQNWNEVVWLTTDGAEINGKLYAYSEELIRYLERKRKEREIERQHGGPRIKW